MFKKIKIIINPASGKPEPILTYLNQAFKSTDTDWDIVITKKAEDAQIFALNALKEDHDLIAVYGGDGTVMEVAQILCQSPIPLAILPGGTANVMAKELGIPTDIPQALQLITAPQTYVKKVDMGMVNDIPFLIRINVGLAADLVTEASREMKDNLGQVAYSVTAIQQAQKSELAHYDMILDGKSISAEGIALIIANSGNMGIQGLSIVHSISPTDGLLDIVVIQSANLDSVMEWINSTLTKSRPTGVIEHWKAKQVSVNVTPTQSIVVDDRIKEISTINAHILEKAISIVVPKSDDQ